MVTVRAQAPYPPVELQTPWPPILALVGVVLVVLAGLLGLLLAALRRRGLSQDLRFGEDA